MNTFAMARWSLGFARSFRTPGPPAIHFPAALELFEHSTDHGFGHVRVSIIGGSALVAQPLQPQHAWHLVLDKPGLLRVAQVVKTTPSLSELQPSASLPASAGNQARSRKLHRRCKTPRLVVKTNCESGLRSR